MSDDGLQEDKLYIFRALLGEEDEEVLATLEWFSEEERSEFLAQIRHLVHLIETPE